MCDIYSHKCDNCKRMIETHIGGWSIPREELHVLCPKCAKKLLDKANPKLAKKLKRKIDVLGRCDKAVLALLQDQGIGAEKAFIDEVRRIEQVWECGDCSTGDYESKYKRANAAKIGDRVVFWTANKKAVHIGLN
jgi:DNA-directed RNA polymerase subunit RPC12/RpoP